MGIGPRLRAGGRLPYNLAYSPISPAGRRRHAIMSDVQQRIDDLVKNNRVVLFMKGTAQFPMCGFSGRAVQILKSCGVDDLKTFNVLEDEGVRQGIKEYANWPTIPQLYVNGEFVGGSDIMMEMYEAGELQQVLGAQA
jgi:monothiol glutaredoxin